MFFRISSYYVKVDASQQRLSASLSRAHSQLDDNANALVRIIDEARKAAAKEIDTAFSAKQVLYGFIAQHEE